MFDTKRVSGEAGLEHPRNDFEADLEFASGPTLILDDFVYEQHQAKVRVVDQAMIQLNVSHLTLIDRLIEANENMLWAADGSPSLAEWLIARYRMTSFTGRALAKITQALPELPNIRRAFEQGRLSWDQLRAVVTIATPETDAELARTAPESSSLPKSGRPPVKSRRRKQHKPGRPGISPTSSVKIARFSK